MKIKRIISRNVLNGNPADLTVTVKTNSDDVFDEIVKEIKSVIRREDYKNKQVGKSRLEYEIKRL